MKKYGLGLCGMLLAGCYQNPLLPDHERDLSAFIPVLEIIEEMAEPAPGVFDFVSEHFPNACEWKSLERVVDGDTIIVDDDKRVRFIGLDTPETKHPKKPIQPWGPEASEKTKLILNGSEKVCLVFDEKGDRYDTYNRLLAYIFTEAGEDVSEQLLSSGLARGYYRFGFEREDEFRFYEQKAKTEAVGVWGGGDR